MTEEEKRIAELEEKLRAFEEAERVRFTIAYGEELANADKTNKFLKVVLPKINEGIIFDPSLGLSVYVNNELMPLLKNKQSVGQEKKSLVEEYGCSEEVIEECLSFIKEIYIQCFVLNDPPFIEQIKEETGFELNEENMNKCIPLVATVSYMREEFDKLNINDPKPFLEDLFYIAMSEYIMDLDETSETEQECVRKELLDESSYGDYYKIDEQEFREVYEQKLQRENKMLKVKYERALEYINGTHEEMEKRRSEEFHNTIERRLEELGLLDEIDNGLNARGNHLERLDIEKIKAEFVDLDLDEAMTLREVIEVYNNFPIEDFDEDSDEYKQVVRMRAILSTVAEEDLDVKVPKSMFFGKSEDDDDDDWDL